MAREIIFNKTLVNDEARCYVIAEIGNNHQGNLDNAKEMIISAKESGASAVKFQKRDNKELFTSEMEIFLLGNCGRLASLVGLDINIPRVNTGLFEM